MNHRFDPDTFDTQQRYAIFVTWIVNYILFFIDNLINRKTWNDRECLEIEECAIRFYSASWSYLVFLWVSRPLTDEKKEYVAEQSGPILLCIRKIWSCVEMSERWSWMIIWRRKQWNIIIIAETEWSGVKSRWY